MQTLLIYQLSETSATDKLALARFKELLKAKGYQNCVCGVDSQGAKSTSPLPENMLCKDRTNAKDVRAELRTIAKASEIIVEWFIAVEMLTWAGSFKKKRERELPQKPAP